MEVKFVASERAYRELVPYKNALDLYFEKKIDHAEFASAAKKLGPYMVSDQIEKNLQYNGIHLPGSLVPFQAAIDFCDECLFSLEKSECIAIPALKEHFERDKVRLIEFSLKDNESELIDKLLAGRDMDIWQRLDLYDLLFHYQNPVLVLHVDHLS